MINEKFFKNLLIKTSLGDFSDEELNDILTLQNKITENLTNKTFYYPSSRNEIRYSTNKRHITYLVYENNYLIAVSHAMEGGLFFSRPINEWINLNSNNYICHEFVFVDPSYRGNGLQKKLMRNTAKEAAAMGFDTLWCCAHPNNTASVQNILSVGYNYHSSHTVDNWERNIYTLNL